VPKHRRRNVSRPIYRMMLQADASIRPWLEDHRPKLALVAMIDNATKKVWVLFRTYEDTSGYLTVLQEICLNEGIPMELYTDKRNVSKDKRELSTEDQLAGKERISNFKGITDHLGIELNQADSPQAKGRIEWLFETLQDQILVKILREAGTQTLEDVNPVLQVYLPQHNQLFIKKAAE